MVLELIILTVLAEAVTIYGLAIWFRYTDILYRNTRQTLPSLIHGLMPIKSDMNMA